MKRCVHGILTGGSPATRAIAIVAVTFIIAVAILAIALPTAARQTPPVVPPPSSCTIAPRQIPTTVATAAPTVQTTAVPFPTPYRTVVGSPVSAATNQAVQQTIHEAIACANAGDVGRSLALLSDGAFAAYLHGPLGLNRAMLRLIATKSQPVPPADRLTLVSISNIASLAAGRVGATVTTLNKSATYSDYVILVNEHGQWRIDKAIPEGTVPHGTPTAAP